MGQCGTAASPAALKKLMGPMKEVTTAIVDAGQKLGEKKPDAKEAKPFQTNAARLAAMNRQLFPMLSDRMCKEVSAKLQKGCSDLSKAAQKKDSNAIADGISQIRASCSECHGCAGL